MAPNELERFLAAWDHEAENTVRVLKALPPAQYRLPPGRGRPVAG